MYRAPCRTRVPATPDPVCEKDRVHEDVTRGEGARCLALILFCVPPSFLFPFLKATSLFGTGAQSSVAGKLDNFFIPVGPPDNFLAVLL